MPKTRPHDWRTIKDEKEKYAAYLCSREWAEKREAVRERARGLCERCLVFPMDACHHLTYARKYNEDLKDLQAICTKCHEFTHGKSDDDPTSWSPRIRRYLRVMKLQGKVPCPYEVLSCGQDYFVDKLRDLMKSIEILDVTIGWEVPGGPIEILNDRLPFDFHLFLCWIMRGGIDEAEYGMAVEYFAGHRCNADAKWVKPREDD